MYFVGEDWIWFDLMSNINDVVSIMIVLEKWKKERASYHSFLHPPCHQASHHPGEWGDPFGCWIRLTSKGEGLWRKEVINVMYEREWKWWRMKKVYLLMCLWSPTLESVLMLRVMLEVHNYQIRSEEVRGGARDHLDVPFVFVPRLPPCWSCTTSRE